MRTYGIIHQRMDMICSGQTPEQISGRIYNARVWCLWGVVLEIVVWERRCLRPAVGFWERYHLMDICKQRWILLDVLMYSMWLVSNVERIHGRVGLIEIRCKKVIARLL